MADPRTWSRIIYHDQSGPQLRLIDVSDMDHKQLIVNLTALQWRNSMSGLINRTTHFTYTSYHLPFIDEHH